MRLPEPFIEERHGLFVLRDDLLPGGTKRRVVHLLITNGDREVVYASPAFGYAQIALAYAGQDVGVAVTIFTAKRKFLHSCTQEAKNAGAKIVLVPYGYLSNVQAKAQAYARLVAARYIPFGFDCPVIARALTALAEELPIEPCEVWTVAGSGTLSRALQNAWPCARVYAVQIGAPVAAGRAVLLRAPEPFEKKAKNPPPFPSCSTYDAKAWQFIKRQASPGALFWNVAA